MTAAAWRGERPEYSAAGLAALVIVSLTLWLLNHPYVGLWHDAQIYAGIVARALRPQDYANELFFTFGSQGDLTIFTALYAPLVGWLGLDLAARVLVLVSAVAWTVAATCLALNLLPSGWPVRFVALCAGLVSINYGPNLQVFNLPESFATARSLAFPAGLAAVAALAGGRAWTAFSLAVLALLVHPLLGVWPLMLVIACRMGPRLTALGCVLVVLATATVGWLDLSVPMLRNLSAAWFAYAGAHSPDAWFRQDGSTHIDVYLVVLAILWLVAAAGNPRHRLLFASMALLATASLALAWLSAYVWPVEIIMQGQPWRAFWLASIIAGVGLVDLLVGQWRQWHRHRRTLIAVAVICVCAAAPLWWGDVHIASVRLVNPWWPGDSPLNGLLAGGMWQTAALLALAPTTLRVLPESSRRRVRVMVLAMASIALAWTVAHWDRRPDHLAIVERCLLNDACPPHPFRAAMKPGEVVYWPNDEINVWLLLRHPTYLSANQRAGGVFSEAKSAESARRERHVAKFVEPFDLDGLCSDPVLQWVVTAREWPGVTAAARDGKLMLYPCARTTAASP